LLVEVEPTESSVNKLDGIRMSLGHDNRTTFAAKIE
jgi:hypothetical protein